MIEFGGNTNEILIRILAAAFLGGLIGLERDIHGRAAGLRTHLLVSMGAAVFMVLSEIIASSALSSSGTWPATSDPARIGAQIVTGIGFLGAGTIIKEGITIRGLTTAACLWTVAAVGMAAGAGCYVIAVGTTFFALCFLIVLHYLERWYPKDSYRALTVTTSNDIITSKIIETISSNEVQIIHIELERDYEADLTTTKFFVRLFHKGLTDRLCHGIISSLEQADIELKKVRWGHR